MTDINTIVRKLRARSANLELMRAIDGANSPALREELLTIAQRHMS